MISVNALLLYSKQEELKSQLVEVDSKEVLSWRSVDGIFSQLHHVAGVDISFVKESPSQACAMVTILNFPQLEVGEGIDMIRINNIIIIFMYSKNLLCSCT